MPEARDAKTKSAPKALAFAVFVIALGGGTLWGLKINKNSGNTLSAPGDTYYLTVVKTVAAQEKGLGGRASLPGNQGMLFEFQGNTVRCFWMKDMRFPLDIIWLNSAKKVVYVLRNVSPSTYPESFCPSEPAEYVIELNAGQAARAGIHVGQTLSF